jgi:hypothetical protein
VICGDWNINLLQKSIHQKAFLSLLLLMLLTMVEYPMRVTTNSSSLIDVIIRNNIFYHTTSRVVEVGYSDHFAQIMNIAVKFPLVHSGKTVRAFSKRNKNI